MGRQATYNLLRVKSGLANLCSKYGIEAAADHDIKLEKSIKAFDGAVSTRIKCS